MVVFLIVGRVFVFVGFFVFVVRVFVCGWRVGCFLRESFWGLGVDRFCFLRKVYRGFLFFWGEVI